VKGLLNEIWVAAIHLEQYEHELMGEPVGPIRTALANKVAEVKNLLPVLLDRTILTFGRYIRIKEH
jgi:hypothetical protein